MKYNCYLLKTFLVVSKVTSQIGGRANISWTAAFFPLFSGYRVFHTYKENRTILFNVQSRGVYYFGYRQSHKYIYHTRPFNSTDIMFEIRDITLDDAGYYDGGASAKVLWSGGGTILTVSGK